MPGKTRLGLVLALLPAALSCTRPPHADLEAGTAAMKRAAESGWTEDGPAVCASAQGLLLHAQAEVRLQSKRWFLARDYDEAIRLARGARADAESCAEHTELIKERTRRRAEAGLRSLEQRIAAATALARQVPDGETIKSDLLQAEITLGEGRASLERGQYERADETMARGMRQVAGALADIRAAFDAFATGPRRSTWRRWALQTIDESRRSGGPAILVDKLRRRLYLLRGGEVEMSYPVDLGIAGTDDKTQAGDEATPEGRYRITEVRGPGQTRYYRALMLDYPNDEDRANFRRLQRTGRIPTRRGIGSNIEIHGKGGRGQDWTQGCVALDNDDIDDLVPRVRVGTSVTIAGTIPDDVTP
jgi:hypothetical protein